MEYARQMSALRQSIFGLIAAAALVFGVGSFTAAMACPSTLPQAAAAIEQTNDNCCEQAPADDCVLRTCSLICHALPPGSSAPIHVTHVEAPYWVGHGFDRAGKLLQEVLGWDEQLVVVGSIVPGDEVGIDELVAFLAMCLLKADRKGRKAVLSVRPCS